MKNNNLKININRPEMSKDEINQLQDFNSVLSNLNKIPKPFYKTYTFYSITTLCIVLLVSGLFWFKPSKQNQLAPEIENVAFINPPFENIQISFASYEVESGQADTIITGSGTRIIIPGSKFLDQNGFPIEGKINIKYREFRDPIDFALSGIPMSYDSAGIKYQFESAGMCEILGEQGEIPVFVNPNTPLVIEMNTVRSDPKFNVYYLDTISKNWTYLNKPKIKKDEVKVANSKKAKNLPEIEEFIEFNPSKISEEIALLKKQKPLAPVKANEGLPHFRLNFNPIDFPELEAYKGAVFEVTEADRERCVKLFAINWDNLRYETIEAGKKYKVIMELYDKTRRPTKNNYTIARTETMLVHPVFEDNDYQKALAIFKEKDKEYTQKVEQKEKDRKAEIAIELENKRQRNLQIEKEIDWSRDRSKEVIDFNLLDVFYAAKFGIYNCDHAYTASGSVKTTLTFVNEKNDPIKIGSTLFHLDYTKNTCIILNYNNCCNNYFTYLANNKNFLFTLLPDGKIGYYSTENCQNLKPRKNNRIEFKISQQSFKTIEDVKEFLSIGIN
jgi:hypothetical protein